MNNYALTNALGENQPVAREPNARNPICSEHLHRNIPRFFDDLDFLLPGFRSFLHCISAKRR